MKHTVDSLHRAVTGVYPKPYSYDPSKDLEEQKKISMQLLQKYYLSPYGADFIAEFEVRKYKMKKITAIIICPNSCTNTIKYIIKNGLNKPDTIDNKPKK